LRDYGLLKFTKKEAYKTWILSLPGFLVASKVLENGNWKIAEDEKEYDSDLHPEIHTAFVNLHTYDDFVSRLTYVCMPNIEMFSTFEEVLRKAHALLNNYWRAIKDPSLNQKERKEESLKRIEQIENLPQIEKFYKEFSTCLNIEKLIKDVEHVEDDPGL
jgi:hypothetical protein